MKDINVPKILMKTLMVPSLLLTPSYVLADKTSKNNSSIFQLLRDGGHVYYRNGEDYTPDIFLEKILKGLPDEWNITETHSDNQEVVISNGKNTIVFDITDRAKGHMVKGWTIETENRSFNVPEEIDIFLAYIHNPQDTVIKCRIIQKDDTLSAVVPKLGLTLGANFTQTDVANTLGPYYYNDERAKIFPGDIVSISSGVNGKINITYRREDEIDRVNAGSNCDNN